MNLRTIFKPLTAISASIAVFMIIPCIIAFSYNEQESFLAFLSIISITFIFSSLTFFFLRNWQIPKLAIKESFLLVVLSWVISSFIAALPFYISNAIPSFSDAFFETASGFSTTGASILTSIESLPKSMLFWRGLTHWLGGMGIVVLAVAILPYLGVGGLQLLKAEAPGPTVDKIAPKIRETAKMLWRIYLGLTILEMVLLRFAGMDWFDASTHSFATLATGGFSTRNASVGAFDSKWIDWIITIFMVLAGINFTLHYRFLTKRTKNVFKNSELTTYLGIIAAAILLITFDLSRGNFYSSISDSFRYASFQVASIITTTGFATADFELWPNLSQFVLFLLMFTGACSGSTGGGIKVIRIVTLFKLAQNEIKYLLHPKAVLPLWIDGKVIKKDMIYSISAFFFLYFLTVFIVTFLCALSGEDLMTSFTAALSTLGNIGPGFGKIGPTENYAFFADWVKWVLSMAMIIGRLEVCTFMVVFTRSFWRD